MLDKKLPFVVGILFSFLISPVYSQYTMPAEWEEHTGTWLQWPHDYTYGPGSRDYFEQAWIEMTMELTKGEDVFIIAYDETELIHIQDVLSSAGVNFDRIVFYTFPNNDYWIRDNGPIYVRNEIGELAATDWGFDGWGNDAPYALCNEIPSLIALATGIPLLDVNEMVLEGGAIEHDGNGTFMATESSILGDNRNPGKTKSDLEDYLSEYLGFEKFIWLEGSYGGSFDITDSHIDGFLKFHNKDTIVTMSNADLAYWYVNASDRTIISEATNVDGEGFEYVYLPLTDKNVKTTDNLNTGSKGSYVNYYVANSVVLVPTYNDDNDSIAIAILQEIMPEKEVVGIDCRNMFLWGGMVHCVTQQQPSGSFATTVTEGAANSFLIEVSPNPIHNICTVQHPRQTDYLIISDIQGRELFTTATTGNSTQLSVTNLSSGQYLIMASGDFGTITRKVIIE